MTDCFYDLDKKEASYLSLWKMDFPDFEQKPSIVIAIVFEF
jgi:hypothetical protein